MKRTFLVISLFLIALVFIPAHASAFSLPFSSFRPFPVFAPTPKPSTPPVVLQLKLKEIKINGKFKKNKNLVELDFKNLDHVKSFTFTLIYTYDGITEAVVDSVIPGALKKIEKDVFLGTCSQGVCTPHFNPKNIKLQVDGLYVNNQSFSKAVNIK